MTIPKESKNRLIVIAAMLLVVLVLFSIFESKEIIAWVLLAAILLYSLVSPCCCEV